MAAGVVRGRTEVEAERILAGLSAAAVTVIVAELAIVTRLALFNLAWLSESDGVPLLVPAADVGIAPAIMPTWEEKVQSRLPIRLERGCSNVIPEL